MSVSSAPIGNTGQALDGFVAPTNFREAVVITDPNDQFGVAPVVSTQPLSGYALPVWIQGTPNFSSTVNITSTVNVTSNISVATSTQIVSSIPLLVSPTDSTFPWIVSPIGTTNVNIVSSIALRATIISGAITASGNVSTTIISSIPLLVSQTATSNPWVVSNQGTTFVNVVSTVPQSVTIGTVSSFPLSTTQVFGTVSTQIVSSIPIFVSQSTNPWTVVLPGTTMVNVVSTVPQSITIGTVSTFPLSTTQVFGQVSSFAFGTTNVNIVSSIALGFTPTGTSFVSISSSQPIIVAQSTVPWQISGTSSVNIISSVALGFTPTGTSMVNIVSSIPLGGGVQYVEGNTTTNPTGNTAMWKSAVSTMVSVSTSNPLPVYQISTGPVGPLVGTTMVNIVSTVIQNNNITSSIPLIVSQSTNTWAVNPNPSSSNGLDTQLYVSVTTAPRTIKNSAGRLYDIWFTNAGTSMAFLKLYNASSASVSTGTTAPLMTFGLPASPTTTGVSGWLGSAFGYTFSTAIAVSVTASSATSTDTSTPVTNQILLQFGYK